MRFVFVNQSLQKRHKFETLNGKKVYKTFRIKENRFFETFYVKDGTKKQESAIMQMIRSENTRNCLRSFQVCCDKTKKMIKTHRYVLDF